MADLRVLMAGVLVVTGGLSACADEDGVLDGEEMDLLATLGNVPDAGTDPTNAYAGSPMAEALGQTLFWDPALSQDNSLGCASCHQPSQGWSIDQARSPGSSGPGGPDGTEDSVLSAWHSPTVQNLGLGDYIFWDGRADSLWAQARGALTSPGVHRLNELQLSKKVHQRYGAEYDAVFGAPSFDLAGIDETTDPSTLTQDEQDELRLITVNIGKAIAAYELLLVDKGSQFDAFLNGNGDLDASARRGAKLFVDDERGCISCHSGPALSDGWFHNVGLEQPADQGDNLGAYEGLASLVGSEFNGVGPWSDDPGAGQDAIDRAQAALDDDPDALRGAFKTPGLRGVTLRPLLGHTGEVSSLEDWIRLYSTGGSGANYPGTNEITPRDYSDDEVADLIAFLTALEGDDLGDLGKSP